MDNPDTLERAAQAAHEVNRVFCQHIADFPSPSWADASEEIRASARMGVRQLSEDPFMTPAESHQRWMDNKLEQGWRYGEAKNEETKTHPCLRPYHELPPSQRAKDHLFRAVVLGILGKPDASFAVACLEDMRSSMDKVMSEADQAVKEVTLTVGPDPEARADVAVHEARGNLAGAISAELAAVIVRISGHPARG